MANTPSLGVGALRTESGAPFTLSIDQWTGIATFLAHVNETSPEAAASVADVIPAYADLRRAAAAWSSRTFPGIVGLAFRIRGYNANVVKRVYPQIEQQFGAWERRPPSTAERLVLQAWLTAATAEAQGNRDAAGPVIADLDALDQAVEKTNQQSQNAMATLMEGALEGGIAELIQRIGDITAHLANLALVLASLGTPPFADLERVRGAWGAVADDLTNLLTWVLAQIDVGEPFLSELNIEAAMAEWDALDAEVQSFTASAGGIGG